MIVDGDWPDQDISDADRQEIEEQRREALKAKIWQKHQEAIERLRAIEDEIAKVTGGQATPNNNLSERA